MLVTSKGDSINCKITKIKKDNIYFVFKHKNEVRNTLLPLSGVKTHQYNYYEKGEISLEKLPVIKSNYKHFRFAVNGGYSYQTAPIDDNTPKDFKGYVRDLKSGYHFGIDGTYYFTEILGAGLKYNLFKSSNSKDNIYIMYPNGKKRHGKMSDDLTISFVAPTFSTRFFDKNKKNAFIINYALGYVRYVNNNMLIDKYKLTADAFALAIDFGYDIQLSKKLSLGFQISFLGGKFTKFDLDDGVITKTVELDKDSAESLNRLDISVGLRF